MKLLLFILVAIGGLVYSCGSVQSMPKKSIYQLSLEEFEQAKLEFSAFEYHMAINHLNYCLEHFPYDVDARILRIKSNNKLKNYSVACADINILRSYGVNEVDQIDAIDCPDNIRWKPNPEGSVVVPMSNDSIAYFDSINKESITEISEIDSATGLTVKVIKAYYAAGSNQLYRDILSKITYPEDCKEGNISGTVILKLTIDVSGRPIFLEVERSVPNGRSLSMEAYKAALSIKKFRPATRNGVPFESSILMPVKFHLQ